jgi:hypothetical protein
MSLHPPARDNSDPLAAFRVGHVEDHTLAHVEQIAALFARGLALVNPLDGERIGEHLDGFIEGNAMLAPIPSAEIARPLFL